MDMKEFDANAYNIGMVAESSHTFHSWFSPGQGLSTATKWLFLWTILSEACSAVGIGELNVLARGEGW